jgi:ubiquinone/menaquinone biosynthesis C-methylase UbiE
MSLLEVGCADGINLVLAAERWPGIGLSGVDVNPRSLAMAQQRLAAMGAERRNFAVSGAERLAVPDRSVDVVVSDAVFMYLAPKAAERALAEMLRVARRGVAVHLFNDEQHAARLEGGNWVHRFSDLMRVVAPDRAVTITRSRLPHGQWEEFGALCVVDVT